MRLEFVLRHPNALRFSLALLLACAMAACGVQRTGSSTDDQADQIAPPTFPRGNDPWVFRSVVDDESRMLTFALSSDLWVAYHTETASFRSAWPGKIDFDSAVFTGAHGPQPTGPARRYSFNSSDRQWSLMRGNEVLPAEIRYLGHRIENGGAIMRFQLTADGQSSVTVEERPERISPAGASQKDLATDEDALNNSMAQSGGAPDKDAGDKNTDASISLMRRFHVLENVDDATPILSVAYQSLANTDAVRTNGGWLESALDETGGFSGALALASQGVTTLEVTFGAPSVIAGSAEAAGEDLPPAVALMQAQGCYSCHADESRIVGPSYAEIRERYEPTLENVSALSRKIISGGGGAWGDVAMIAHPGLSASSAQQIVAHILNIEGGVASLQQTNEGPLEVTPVAPLPEGYALGAITEFYEVDQTYQVRPLLQDGAIPQHIERMNVAAFAVDAWWSDEIVELNDVEDGRFSGGNVISRTYGQFYVDAPGEYEIVLWMDHNMGALSINGETILDAADGPNRNRKMVFESGWYPFEIRAYYNQMAPVAAFRWIPPGGKEGFVPASHIAAPISAESAPVAEGKTTALDLPPRRRGPGDRVKLDSVHPSFKLRQARPDNFEGRIGAMDFLPDGRLVASTWDGDVYILDGVAGDDPAKMSAKKIAFGLAEPLGLKVVDGEIYVMQKQELTKLIDEDGDEIADEYRTISQDWETTGNFHEFGFGLVYGDGGFYATLAAAVLPGGDIAPEQGAGRGSLIHIDRETGKVTRIAHGFRAPNGVARGIGGDIYIGDNEGNWLPSSKIVRVKKDQFYGYRSIDFANDRFLEETPPLVWLPQNEIGNSPTQPAPLNKGPYQNQMIHGDIFHGGLKRVSMDEVDGVFQGCVFRFMQGFESSPHRAIWGPDENLYIGQLTVGGNWGVPGTLPHGLQKLEYVGDPTFEMLSLRAMTGGFEITFTEPVADYVRLAPEDLVVKQWRYEPTVEYGGPKLDETNLDVTNVMLSDDRKRAFVALDGVQPEHVVYIHFARPPVSAGGREMWTTETWCTVNSIPDDRAMPTFVKNELNTLTAAEKAMGWQLLFDGETFDGWRAFGGEAVGDAWQIDNGAMTLTRPGGGDIVSEQEYEDFELTLEWAIAPAGNSGIMYFVQESPGLEYPWESGLEMQILDNEGHSDGKIISHMAGALYDLEKPLYANTAPIGEFNRVRIVVKDGRIEHWQNGRKVVDVSYGDPEWEARVAASKFAGWEHFAKSPTGRISLQDHDDRVWFRNIKIRPL